MLALRNVVSAFNFSTPFPFSLLDCFNYEAKSCQGDFIKQINSFQLVASSVSRESSGVESSIEKKKKHKSEYFRGPSDDITSNAHFKRCQWL